MAAYSAIVAAAVVVLLSATFAAAREPHIIKFRSPNLFPESAVWDPAAQHFIVGSFRNRSFHSVTDAGVTSPLLTDPSLPENAIILGLAVDTINRRLLAAITSIDNSAHPPFNALAAYDLRSLTPLFLTPLPSDPASTANDGANDVAVDFEGNAYVTNSGNSFIWKVNFAGEASIFSRSPLYSAYDPINPASPYSACGLNGIHYVSKGYLLVVQSNTGKLFKVDAVDGTARRVILEDLYLADGITMRSDGNLLIISPEEGVWVLKSDDGFGEARVVEKVAVDKEGFPTAVLVGGGERVYLLNGHIEEGLKGNSGREWFSLEEVRESSGDDSVWVYVLIGLGLVYFLVWRFQMGQLVKNLDKKVH